MVKLHSLENGLRFELPLFTASIQLWRNKATTLVLIRRIYATIMCSLPIELLSFVG